MFISMIRDLQTSHFTLPAVTTYNHAGIPFAYPPLGFYMAGILNTVTHLSLTSILRWQPFIVNLLVLLLFFLFAKQFTDSENKAALATLIFALTPNSYWWQITGGGLTRTLGAVFFLLTIIFADRMYRTRKPIWIVATIAAGSLTVLSHPEWALQATAAVVLFWFFHGRDRGGLIVTAVVGAGIAILTAPWWVAVTHQHGLSVFLQAGQATNSRWLFWTIPLTMGFTGEYIPVIAVLGVCGLFLHFAKKEYLLPVWALFALFVDPRGGMPASIFPFSIMAATTLTEGLAARLSFTDSAGPKNDWENSLLSGVGRIFWGTFIIIFLYSALQVSTALANQSLDAETRNAFQWVSTHTQPADQFLILDWQENPLLSAPLEWFPVLSDRRSITTVQGSEWLGGERGFQAQMDLAQTAHACIFQNETCLQSFSGQYEYILLSLEISRGTDRNFPLLLALENSPEFSLVYSTPGIKIFRVKK